MGVPTFYRWVSEKYPKIVINILEQRNNVIDGIEIPLDLTAANPNGVEYDNLFVDMNGLIHPCSHPEDREAPATEEEMFINITKYIDRLVAATRPRRLIYLAIDGVAPRAKMNQQRSRRFRAAQDAKDRKELMKEITQEMLAMGHVMPEKADDWDSNVITPGTTFMNKLSVFLRFYVIEKMNMDPFWKGVKVIMSDASEPGEGEHKIMSYIRNQRVQEGYDPNQHHILHGLDADLIMLALATHEAHFTILREEVKSRSKTGKQRPDTSEGQELLDANWIQNGATLSSLRPDDEWVFGKSLQALRVHVLRDYLDNEFACLKPECGGKMPFAFDLERVIDDFVFMCFFVGNDFIPHLPSLDIRDGALDFLLMVYKDVLPSLGDYITAPGGRLNLRQANVVLGKVGDIESKVFAKRKQVEEEQDQAPKSSKTTGFRPVPKISLNNRQGFIKGTKTSKAPGGKNMANPHEQTLDPARLKAAKQRAGEELKRRLKAKEAGFIERYKEEMVDNVRLHEKGHKERYYSEKYIKENLEHGGGLGQMCASYVQGLCWVLRYYFDGVPSWNWYYPFHYAPLASDLLNIDTYQSRFRVQDFELSQPFRPFEQLLAVLPASSAAALPEPIRWLMTNDESPIKDLYTDDVPMDPNGKILPWLWILLLPFVNETRVSAAFNGARQDLDLADLRRNSKGGSMIFLHECHALASHALSRGAVSYAPARETDPEVLAATNTNAQVGVFNVAGGGSAASIDSIHLFDSVSGTGMSGIVGKPPAHWYAQLHAPVPLPHSCPAGGFCGPVCANQVLVLSYALPPAGRPHESRLLRGAVPEKSILNELDLRARRPPRLGGFNTIDLVTPNSEKTKTLPCKYWPHKCSKGDMCSYIHAIDLAAPISAKTKTLPCKYWPHKCSKGDMCTYIHAS